MDPITVTAMPAPAPAGDPVETFARWAFLFLLIYSLVLAAVFVLHYYDRATRGDSEALPFGTHLRIYAQEWLFSLAAGLLYPLGWLPRLEARTFEPEGGPPILLLHGYGMNRSCWFAVYWRLRRLGLRNIYTLNLKPRLGSIETIGEGVCDEIYELSELCDGQPVHLIAHSMSGVISRWCVDQDPELPVACIITIGSPHHGTRIAVLGPGENAAQLRPDSELLTGLSPEPRVPLVSIYSRLDGLVIPSESSHFGTTIIPCLDGGHITLLFSGRTFARLRPYLPEAAGPITS